MLALVTVSASCLYLIGLRADRIHAQRAGAQVSTFGAGRGSDTKGAAARNSRPTKVGGIAVQPSEGTVSTPGVTPVRFVSRPAPARGLYRGHSAAFYAWRLRIRTRQLQAARHDLRRRWTPTVTYALSLASAVFGVPYSELAAVSHCESTWNPFARNGGQLGLFQLGWRPFGLDPFDPIANALSAAQTVRQDGSWRQWVCKP